LNKAFLFAAAAATLLLGAAACAPVKLLNTITPSGSFERDKDISYGNLARQKLDIYRAASPRPDAPVLIFVHGGSWDSGSKNIYKFLGQGFTSEGFDVVIPALMRPEFYPGGTAAICKTIAGVVAFAPPTGIIPLKEEPFITIFPDRFTGADAPMNNAESIMPPVLFVHGQKDTTVYPQNSQRLAEKITARGGQAVVKTYEDLDHIDVIKVTSKFFDGDASLKSDVIEFIGNLRTGGENFCR